MSIRDELKAKRERYEGEKERKTNEIARKYKDEARWFLEKYIIPRFRELASIYPENYYLDISFSIHGSDCIYTEIETLKRVPVKREVVIVATSLASEYDIESRTTYHKGELYGYEFSLRLK